MYNSWDHKRIFSCGTHSSVASLLILIRNVPTIVCVLLLLDPSVITDAKLSVRRTMPILLAIIWLYRLAGAKPSFL